VSGRICVKIYKHFDGDKMTDIKTRNEKAKNKGIKGELESNRILKEVFNEIEFVNGLIDYIADKKPVEIKTCQEWQSNGKRRCRGRFVLDEDQHKHLCKKNGYYLFIVLKEKGFRFSLVKASKMKFNRKISWVRAFSYPTTIKGDISYVESSD